MTVFFITQFSPSTDAANKSVRLISFFPSVIEIGGQAASEYILFSFPFTLPRVEIAESPIP